MKLFESNMIHKKNNMLTSKKRIQYLILIVLLLQISNSFAQFDPIPLFSDEFKDTQLDKSKWGIDRELYRGIEVQCYTMDAKNVTLDGENLQLIARKESTPYTCNFRGAISQRNYTSGSIRTVSTITNLGYGKYEARIKVPVGLGYFTAFWTLGLGGGWPSNGEVDIMESVGQLYGPSTNRKLEDFVRATCHWSDISGQHASGPKKESPKLDMSQYHIYSVERTPNSVKWFVNDIMYTSLDIFNNVNGTAELHANHSILFNFALGGWPPAPNATTPFPATMYVDYVRYYKYNAALSVPENDINKMKVYTKGNMCNITLPKTLVDLELTFYSMTGQKLITKSYYNTGECALDISSLSKGNYILQVTSSNSENYSGLFINN